MLNRRLLFFAITFIIVITPARVNGAEQEEPANQKEAARKGVQLITEGGRVVRELEDKNGDGKPDITTYYVNGKKHHGEGASRFDGKIDTGYIYSTKGVLRQIAKDTNGDGKPDQFITMLKGRNLMLKESDRNFDGRIDQRKLVTWSAERLKIPGQTPIPGYIPLWTEGDDNFDGKIDIYTERGNKNPSKEKMGKPIDVQPAPVREEAASPQSSNANGPLDPTERKIKQMNDQHGIKA